MKIFWVYVQACTQCFLKIKKETRNRITETKLITVGVLQLPTQTVWRLAMISEEPMLTALTVDVVTTEVSPGITQSTFDIIHSLVYFMHYWIKVWI